MDRRSIGLVGSRKSLDSLCLPHTGKKVRSRVAGSKGAVGAPPGGQVYDAGLQAGTFQAAGEEARSPLAGLVGILVEGDIDATAGLITKLRPLHRGQVSADRTGGVPKAGLPKHRHIAQYLHQDAGREDADRVPRKQATLGARQQPVGKSGTDTAAIEIDDASLLVARKDDTPAKGIPALVVDQAGAQQQIQG